MRPLRADPWIETVAEVDPRWTREPDSLRRGQMQRCIDAMKSKHQHRLI